MEYDINIFFKYIVFKLISWHLKKINLRTLLNMNQKFNFSKNHDLFVLI